MGKVPNELREIIARNIRECRLKNFPGRGGGKRCAEAFGVPPQQWSPWERGKRTPDELRLSKIADFFGVTVEWMRSNNTPPPPENLPEPPQDLSLPPFPLLDPSLPGSPASFYWLARDFFKSMQTHGLRLDKESLEYLAQCIKNP